MGTKTQKLSNIVDSVVEWQSVKTGNFTAVAGEGYFINTTSGAVTVTLPASPKAGDIVQLKDYARTWNTNNVTIASALTDGSTTTNTFSTQGQTVTFVYMDGTKGWSLINEDTTSELLPPATFIAATGGTITTSGDFKIHTFTGDGCFVTSSVGNSSINPLGGPAVVDYLVIAGGGGASSAGGGAGGFRESSGAASGCYSTSPLGSGVSGITVSATTYPITVGAGGSAGACVSIPGTQGSNSVFSTITSAGGGRGNPLDSAGQPGGSGSGASAGGSACFGSAGGSGNSPPVSPPQGNNGGSSSPAPGAGGGGGGATSVGSNGSGNNGGNGGNGATSSINGSPTVRAGGGGSGMWGPPGSGSGGGGGPGGGGVGANSNTGTGTAGSSNTGAGGGGGGGNCGGIRGIGAAGGKGIVIIRYKYQ